MAIIRHFRRTRYLAANQIKRIMNTSLTPATRLSRLFTDWLRPDSLIDREFFDWEPSLLGSRLGVNVPSVNYRETPKEFILEVAAPGLERKDFKLEIDNNTLCISAEKEEKKEESEKGNGYFRKEYSYNSFSRSFALPENIKEGAIDAKYENGILTVTVPKQKETPTKAVHTIAVK